MFFLCYQLCSSLAKTTGVSHLYVPLKIKFERFSLAHFLSVFKTVYSAAWKVFCQFGDRKMMHVICDGWTMPTTLQKMLRLLVCTNRAVWKIFGAEYMNNVSIFPRQQLKS